MEKNKVAIGWIDSGSVTSGFAAFISQILLHRSDMINSVVTASGAYLSANRNTMVKTFLYETDAEWLLSLDSDMLIDLNSFDELLNAADVTKHQIIAGKYYVPIDSGPELAAQVWHKELKGIGAWINHDDEILNQPIIDNLHSVGAGYMLVHRKVFETILENSVNPMPWFQDYWMDYPYEAWCSDDIHFFTEVHKYDFNVALCTKAKSTHLKTTQLNDDVWLSFQNFNKYQQDKHYKTGKTKSWWVKGKGNK
jgi:hypothetical protein